MNQLDRLEALAESKPRAGSLSTAWAWLPDLIRVARAARDLGWNDKDGKCWCIEPTCVTGLPHIPDCLTLRQALAPLYREVES